MLYDFETRFYLLCINVLYRYMLADIVIMQHHFKHAGLVHFKCWLSSYCTDTLVGSGAIINK